MEEIKTYILTHKKSGEPYVMTEATFRKVVNEVGQDSLQAHFDIEVVLAPKVVSPP